MLEKKKSFIYKHGYAVKKQVIEDLAKLACASAEAIDWEEFSEKVEQKNLQGPHYLNGGGFDFNRKGPDNISVGIDDCTYKALDTGYTTKTSGDQIFIF